ncbi:MAG: hypothetical protein K940chlam2_00114 [Chlamydiae bacterium]|nr:hypothetical protein [Chlamydiota bacterium]
MKKILAILTIGITSTIFSNEQETCTPCQDSFAYYSFSLGPFPWPAPGVGIGYRSQFNHFGWDTNLRVSSIYVLSQLKLSTTPLYYFHPEKENPFYMGVGVGASVVNDPEKWGGKTFYGTLSPELKFGKQFGQRQFVQMEVSYPTWTTQEKTWHLPLVLFSYGKGF